MYLLLQVWTDPAHTIQKSSLEDSAFSLCFAWRFGDFWRFGDLFYFCQKMVIYIVTKVIKGNVTIDAWAKHKICGNHLRVRMLENNGWQ